MKRANFKTIYVTVICLIITLLCGCNLFVTDKDKFYMDKNLITTLSDIDIEKSGRDIIIPAKVGDTTVSKIYLADPYFAWIDSLDVSKVKELESFTIILFDPKNKSKLKELDFSKNKKLRLIEIGQTKALKDIKFNSTCESIHLNGTSVKKVELKKLEKLEDFSYFDGPLEELDISNNPNIEEIWIKNTNIKVLDVSKNPKLRIITVDKGTQVIGPTNAQIEYNKKTE
ncbi:hypothetical protein [Mogibacterium diversum]|uniref:hypothetical protein n=1 Tax=Mogibacterium diversum TaxID=114527 RepID=UPI0028EE7D25|nr:hypothetical protein [Mogibacterium diversum]